MDGVNGKNFRAARQIFVGLTLAAMTVSDAS